MEKFVSLEIPQYSSCNLDCVYCYIPKNEILKKINKKWAALYRDNRYLELISESFKTQELECLSLWGGEPTLGFKDIRDTDAILAKFPLINRVSTSSNMTYPQGVEYLMRNLNSTMSKFDKKIEFEVQVSIDGDEEQTDRNRGKGVYKKVLNSIERILEVAKETPNVILGFHPKSTSTDKDFEEYVKNPDSLRRFFKTMDYIDKTYSKVAAQIPNVRFGFRSFPTLALPGSYTTEDGKYFHDYYLLAEKMIAEEFPDWAFNDTYFSRFAELMNSHFLLNRFDANKNFHCSAGTHSLSIDPDGTIHGCHVSFWYNYEDYLEKNLNLDDWCSKDRIIEYDSGKYWENIKPSMSMLRDDYNQARMLYVLKSYAFNLDNHLNTTFGTIKMLAIANQISEAYKEDSWAKLFSYFLVLKSGCWANNMIVNSALAVPSLSIYRMYGNGLFERLVEKYEERRSAR